MYQNARPEQIAEPIVQICQGLACDNAALRRLARIFDAKIVQEAEQCPAELRSKLTDLGIGRPGGHDWTAALAHAANDFLTYADVGVFPGDSALSLRLPPVEGRIGYAYLIDLDRRELILFKGPQCEPHEDGLFATVADDAGTPNAYPVRPYRALAWGEVNVEAVRRPSG